MMQSSTCAYRDSSSTAYSFPEDAHAWSPLPPPWSECRSDGDFLVAPRESTLPPRCLKCGARATERRTAKLYWHNPWWYLLLLISFWAYAIVALVIRKKAVLEVGLCARHEERRRRGRLTGWLMMLAAVGVSFAVPLGLLVGVFLLPLGVIVLFVSRRLAHVKRMDDAHVWLEKVHPSVVRALPPAF
jgi:hypothetical protein